MTRTREIQTLKDKATALKARWPVYGEMVGRQIDTVSLYGEDDKEYRADQKPLQDELLAEKELSEKIAKAIKRLDEREAMIVRAYFGFDGEEQKLQKLGDQLGVSRERVHQIREKALGKLRRYLCRLSQEDV